MTKDSGPNGSVMNIILFIVLVVTIDVNSYIIQVEIVWHFNRNRLDA
jgi:hypothetical protein